MRIRHIIGLILVTAVLLLHEAAAAEFRGPIFLNEIDPGIPVTKVSVSAAGDANPSSGKAVTLNNLGNLHSCEKRTSEARLAFKEALQIYKDFSKLSPGHYEPKVKMVQRNLDSLK